MNKSLVKKIDIVVSKLIRQRDDLGGFFICCSCGVRKPSEQADAGHFINRRYMSTRWNLSNIHSQCRADNRFGEGDAAGYTLFMIDKYGRKHVEYLQALKRVPARFTDADGELMLKDFKQQLKALQ